MNLQRAFIAKICPLLDLGIAALLCLYLNDIAHFTLRDFEPAFEHTPSTFVISVSLLSLPFTLHFLGFYKLYNLQNTSKALIQIVGFAAYCFSLCLVYDALSNNELWDSSSILLGVGLCSAAVYLRYLIFHLAQIYTKWGRASLDQTLLLGTQEDIDKGWEQLQSYWRVKHRSTPLYAITHQTSVEEVQHMIETHFIQSAFAFGPSFVHSLNHEIIDLLVSQGISINRVLNPKDGRFTHAQLEKAGKVEILTLSTRPEYTWEHLAKSILGRIVALIALVCSLPLWIIAMVGIKISDPKGSVFFKQERSGLYGKPFQMWKFRSMYMDADKQLDHIKETLGNEVDGPIFKLTHDPRVLPFGNFIRKTSIDELPQLINVLLGDMSIVGPRPLPTYETELFELHEHRRRLSVKPGLICYWQIEDRSEATDFQVMIDKDLKYIDNWSLWLDIVLFLRAIPAVLFCRGAK